MCEETTHLSQIIVVTTFFFFGIYFICLSWKTWTRTVLLRCVCVSVEVLLWEECCGSNADRRHISIWWVSVFWGRSNALICYALYSNGIIAWMDCGWGHTAHSTVEVHFKVEIWGDFRSIWGWEVEGIVICVMMVILLPRGARKNCSRGRLKAKPKPREPVWICGSTARYWSRLKVISDD